MTATVHPLRCQEITGQVATTDRAATADLILDVAVKTAVALFREGCPGRARFVLTRAAMRADRILGSTP